jgi:beta-galactosidase
LLPHAGTDSRRWRDVRGLGALVGWLGEVAGATVDAPTAVLVDWDSAWACQQDAHPSEDVHPFLVAMSAHRAISRTGTGCDVIPLDADLAGYRVIVVPAIVLLSSAQADRLAAAAEAGAHVVVTYFSGIADRSDRIVTGGYPGVLREFLGVRSEEFSPLGPSDVVRWDDGTSSGVWTEDTVCAAGTEVVARYADGPAAGFAALTRRTVGRGAAWYLSTQPDPAGLARVLARVLDEAGAAPAVPLPGSSPAVVTGQVDVVRRRSGDRSWLFAINHADVEVELPVSGFDLVRQAPVAGGVLRIPAGGYSVVRESPSVLESPARELPPE